jgi:putative ABC transport system permease protein
MPGVPSMSSLFQDLRQAVRQLRRAPGFTAVAATTLALGVGANSAIFSVVNAVLLRPLPYRDSADLVRLEEIRPDATRTLAAYPNAADWGTGDGSFDAIAILREQSFNLSGGVAERVSGAFVSANFLGVFGVTPALGRPFAPGEGMAGHDAVALVSHALWQRRFGGAPDMVGRIVTVDGRPVTVVGVTPAGFRYPADADLWLPVSRDIPDLLNSRGLHAYEVVGRLNHGVTIEVARTRLAAIVARLGEAYPGSNKGWGVAVDGLQDSLVRPLRPTLLLLIVAVAFVLLIAATNVANMMLARGAGRRHELAIRAALGASRARLVRQLLTESLLLALLGGVLGLLVATWAVSGYLALGPAQLVRQTHPVLDARVMGFALATTVLSSVIFGLAPALLTMERCSGATVRQDARGGVDRQRSRRVLVAAEVAFSLLLLVGAGLMTRSLVRLQGVDPGFRGAGVLTARVSVSGSGMDSARVAMFYPELVERVRNLPGVTAAAAVSYLPLGREGAHYRFLVEGRPAVEESLRPAADFYAVTPGYFGTLGVPLLQGRDFGPDDRTQSQQVAVVNATMARRFWPGQSAVGGRFTWDDPSDDSWLTVVGVVTDVKQGALTDAPRPQVYIPASQSGLDEMALLVRAGTPPAELTPAIRETVRGLAPGAPIADFRTLDALRSASLVTDRFRTALLGSFALLALVLAAIGVYGVIAYGVAQRSRELGIRIALGARRSEIVRLVLYDGLAPVTVGVVIGMLGAAGMSRFVRSLLFEVGPLDPPTFVATALALVVVAVAATLVPARRATAVDPAITLRGE